MARNFRGIKFSMIMSLGNFLRIKFRGWQVLKPMIDNQLNHVIIIVHLAMADIDTY